MYHWYTGIAPPLIGVAVNFTLVPAQTGLASAEMVTLAGKSGLTVIVMAFDVAGEPVRQGAGLAVMTTVITSPLTGA